MNPRVQIGVGGVRSQPLDIVLLDLRRELIDLLHGGPDLALYILASPRQRSGQAADSRSQSIGGIQNRLPRESTAGIDAPRRKAI